MVQTNIKRLDPTIVSPNWRYDCCFRPQDYGFKGYLGRTVKRKNSLLRYATVPSFGLKINIQNKFPKGLSKYFSYLTKEEQDFLTNLWYLENKKFKKPVVSGYTPGSNNHAYIVPWDLGKLDNLEDEFLARAIKHFNNFEYDPYIQYAVNFSKGNSINTKDTSILFNYIGYQIFGGKTDSELAKVWKMPVKAAEALRLLFFDFSRMPKDRTLVFATLRQLQYSGVLDETEFDCYKRIYDLGYLGLRARDDFYSLTDEEQVTVKRYLSTTVVSNVYNINMTIRNQKDAQGYQNILNNLGNFYIKQEEMKLLDAKVRNLNAGTERILKETGQSSSVDILDAEAMEYLKNASMRQGYSNCPSLIDLEATLEDTPPL